MSPILGDEVGQIRSKSFEQGHLFVYTKRRFPLPSLAYHGRDGLSRMEHLLDI